jgi:hypothetical protein
LFAFVQIVRFVASFISSCLFPARRYQQRRPQGNFCMLSRPFSHESTSCPARCRCKRRPLGNGGRSAGVGSFISADECAIPLPVLQHHPPLGNMFVVKFSFP